MSCITFATRSNPMVLTERERVELHAALLEYLQQHGLAESAAAFEAETKTREPRTFKDHSGALEKRWNTLRRLNLANAQLEQKNKELREELEASLDPTKRTARLKALLPRDPATHTFSGHRDTVNAVAFHPFEPFIYSGSEDGTVRQWDLEMRSGKAIARDDCAISALAVEPTKGDLLAVGSGEPHVRLFSQGECVMTLLGHEDAVTCLAWRGDVARTLISASRDGEVRVWDTVRGAATAAVHCPSWVRAIDCAGAHVLVGCNDERSYLVNVASKAVARSLHGHSNVVQCVAFANFDADGVIVEAVGSADQKAAYKHAVKAQAKPATRDTYDPRYAATGGRDKNIIIFDLGNGQPVMHLDAHENWVRGLQFAGTGKHLLSCADDSTVRVFELATKRVIKVITAHDHFVTCFAMHPTGQPLMVTGSADNTLKLWPCG